MKAKIVIAPGNHDFGFNNQILKREFHTSALSHKLPQKISFKKLDIVVEDSTNNNWLFDIKMLEFIKEIDNSKKLIIVRHHIPVQELVYLSNSKSGYFGGLPKISDLKNYFKKEKETIIIAGDGGAFSYLPRIFCLQNKNFKIIINGVGDKINDTVLIINNGIIYTYNLNKFN